MLTAWTFPLLFAASLPTVSSEVAPTTSGSTPSPAAGNDDAAPWARRQEAINRAFSQFQEAWIRSVPDARLLALQEQKRQLEMALPVIAHRQPFDAAALKKAYRERARIIGEMGERNAELIVERLAGLSQEDRDLVIERIPYLSTPMIATPPPSSK